MAITIKNQSFFSEIGKRANNEDNGGWNEGTTYVVCDGVGGNERGEIASDIITNTLLEIYKNDLSISPILSVKEVENQLTKYITQNPDSMGMASTLVMAIVQTNGILTAWVGDSRIYQFRNGKIIFKTTDHSWVNEALATGILKPEEAVNHPKSNIITRAIQGRHKDVEVQEVWLQDIQNNDLFLLCTDGVLETWTDEELCLLFANTIDTDIIANKIKAECAQTSKDNNTAIVFRIEKVEGLDDLTPKELPKSKNELLLNKNTQKSDHLNDLKIHKKYKKLFFLLLFIVIVFILSKVLFKNDNNPGKTPATSGVKPTVIKTEVKPTTTVETQNATQADAVSDNNNSSSSNTYSEANNVNTE
jgi:protein phosphatase